MVGFDYSEAILSLTSDKFYTKLLISTCYKGVVVNMLGVTSTLNENYDCCLSDLLFLGVWNKSFFEHNDGDLNS